MPLIGTRATVGVAHGYFRSALQAGAYRNSKRVPAYFEPIPKPRFEQSRAREQAVFLATTPLRSRLGRIVANRSLTVAARIMASTAAS